MGRICDRVLGVCIVAYTRIFVALCDHRTAAAKTLCLQFGALQWALHRRLSFLSIRADYGMVPIGIEKIALWELDMAEPKVKSFRATWSQWDISWRWTDSGRSTIRLPVTFRLELEPGSSKRDVMMGQQIRGESSDASGTKIFENWEMDGPVGDAYGWNGNTMSTAGMGEWDSAGLVATFEDKPGFNSVKGALYWGSAGDRRGYFDFRTFVVTRSLNVLAEIFWSMRIDVPNPGKGGTWFSYSNQK